MYCTLTPQVIPFSTLALICMRYEQATPWEYIDHVEHLNSTSALWQHQREAVIYVDVVWFVFHVQLLHIRFTQQNVCCISKSMMKRIQKPYWRLGLP